MLITPHAGELARLLPPTAADIEARRLHYATRGRCRARRDRAAQGIHDGHRRAGRQPASAGELDRHPLAGHRRVRRRACPGWPARCSRRASTPRRPPRRPLTCRAWRAAWPRDDAPIGAADLLGALPAAIRAVTQPDRPANVGNAGSRAPAMADPGWPRTPACLTRPRQAELARAYVPPPDRQGAWRGTCRRPRRTCSRFSGLAKPWPSSGNSM